MKRISVFGRRNGFTGSLLVVLCAIVCMVISVPVMADSHTQSEAVQSLTDDFISNAPQSATGMADGHDYVDLGLSVKWAACNVGASSPSEYGDYFAWGETAPKSEYTEENYKARVNGIDDISGNPQYDAARANWGDSWRMPTEREMQELIEECTWTWTTQDGRTGYKVTSKINGNSIFLPAAGARSGSSLILVEYGSYLCSNYRDLPLRGDGRGGVELWFSKYDGGVCPNIINVGRSVRPVMSSETSSIVDYMKASYALFDFLCDEMSDTSISSDNSTPESPEAAPQTATDTIGGHDYVDLGLSVKWAACNVGASSPLDYGDYFAWGETAPKSEYTEDNYKACGRDLGDISGNPQYDAARANWGGSWRMPTKQEMQELIDNCSWTIITQGGHNIYKVTSKINGNYILLPTAGAYGESVRFLIDELGLYMSSTPYDSDAQNMYYLSLDKFNSAAFVHVLSSYRYWGHSVRPVVPSVTDTGISSENSTPESSEAVLQPATGTIGGHEYVDLGLSVKWAACNVGASSPLEYGDYFAWGETSPKSEYTGKNIIARFGPDDISGNPRYDAARANWGGSWRMPTRDEMQELVEECTWTWTTQDGHVGYKVTSKINGNSIFLPAAGLRSGSSLKDESEEGSYWCSSRDKDDVCGVYFLSFFNLFKKNYYHISEILDGRPLGFSVRPVSE